MLFEESQLLFKVIFFVLGVWIKHGETYNLPEPKVEILLPRGLRISIPDDPGLTEFIFHGAINRSLEGMQIGDFYGRITQPSDNRWIYENMEIALQTGDVLSFWAQLRHNNDIYRLMGRSITIPNLFNPISFQDTERIVNSTKPDYECTKSSLTRPPVRSNHLKVTVCLSASKP